MRPRPTKIIGSLTVIGDIHGQADQLDALLARLTHRPDFAKRWLIFLGDFLDRGPEPRRALETVIALRHEHPKFAAVMGNHDLAIAGALGLVRAPVRCNWPKRYVASYNAGTTFASYGVGFGDLRGLANSMPESRQRFLADLPWCVEHPKYLIVHAGLIQDEPFAAQLKTLRRRDFTLNRPEWLCDPRLAHTSPPKDCPLTIVSGHVRVPAVRFEKRRILVDTTGGHGGELSAVLLPERLVITSGPSISDTTSSNPGIEPGSSNSSGETHD